jgi:hypothetical protein
MDSGLWRVLSCLQHNNENESQRIRSIDPLSGKLVSGRKDIENRRSTRRGQWGLDLEGTVETEAGRKSLDIGQAGGKSKLRDRRGTRRQKNRLHGGSIINNSINKHTPGVSIL